jgi:hypothetical protein
MGVLPNFVWKSTSPNSTSLQRSAHQSRSYKKSEMNRIGVTENMSLTAPNRQVWQKCGEQEETLKQELTESKIISVLDWAYDKAVNGVIGLDSATEMAEDYLSKTGSLDDKVNALIRWQTIKAGTSGFLTGLGGIITIPATIPANLASVIYIQIRMIAAIAYMGVHDLKDDRVKTLVYACLVGNSVKDFLKEIGIVIGTKLTTQAIKNISEKTIVTINQKVGFCLLTKFGEKGVINLGKAVPIVGGVIGGSVDSIMTNYIGQIARDTFILMKTEN